MPLYVFVSLFFTCSSRRVWGEQLLVYTTTTSNTYFEKALCRYKVLRHVVGVR